MKSTTSYILLRDLLNITYILNNIIWCESHFSRVSHVSFELWRPVAARLCLCQKVKLIRRGCSQLWQPCLASSCLSCFFLSTISNSSRSLSSSKLCHQAGNGGSQNFLRVSVHALLNQWPSGQSEVLLLVTEPQIESLSEGNHRSKAVDAKSVVENNQKISSPPP